MDNSFAMRVNHVTYTVIIWPPSFASSTWLSSPHRRFLKLQKHPLLVHSFSGLYPPFPAPFSPEPFSQLPPAQLSLSISRCPPTTSLQPSHPLHHFSRSSVLEYPGSTKITRAFIGEPS